MALALRIDDDSRNPLDRVEQLAIRNGWTAERVALEEVDMLVAGTWGDLHLALNWRDEFQGLHLACTFDAKVPAKQRPEVARLIGLINEQMLFGHFDLWQAEGSLIFRNGLLLSGQADATFSQLEDLISIAVEACERYFPAFQFVIWAGNTAEEALRSSLLETVGEA